jgi:hypothetical protein
MAYGLVDIAPRSGINLYWNITEKGKSLMMELRVVRKEITENEL